MTATIANNIPYNGKPKHVTEALADCLAFASNDWGASRATAWIYGIVLGWDPDPEDDDEESAIPELAERWGWTPDAVAELRRLHNEFIALTPKVPT